MHTQFPWLALTSKMDEEDISFAEAPLHAVAKQQKALEMRKLSILDENSWEIKKKQLQGKIIGSDSKKIRSFVNQQIRHSIAGQDVMVSCSFSTLKCLFALRKVKKGSLFFDSNFVAWCVFALLWFACI